MENVLLIISTQIIHIHRIMVLYNKIERMLLLILGCLLLHSFSIKLKASRCFSSIKYDICILYKWFFISKNKSYYRFSYVIILCVYMYTHTHTHTHIYICICMYVYTCIYVCVYVYVCVCIYVCICMCVYVCICIYIYVYLHIYMCNVCIYLCMYLYIFILSVYVIVYYYRIMVTWSYETISNLNHFNF